MIHGLLLFPASSPDWHVSFWVERMWPGGSFWEAYLWNVHPQSCWCWGWASILQDWDVVWKKLSMVNGVVITAQCCTSFETHVWQWVCKLAFVEVTSASCSEPWFRLIMSGLKRAPPSSEHTAQPVKHQLLLASKMGISHVVLNLPKTTNQRCKVQEGEIT